MRRIILAIDSFKGCLTSSEANEAAAEGILSTSPDAAVTKIPVSDGGEGWLDAFQSAWGGTCIDVNLKDPLMRPVVAQYLMKDETAVIEMAKASGLTLLRDEERNPLVATSYGTGLLVVDAVRRGCRRVLVGLGGSATSDCGIGMLQAIIDGFAKHGTWDDVRALDDVRFTIATDVTNPLAARTVLPMCLHHRRVPHQRWSSPLMPVPNVLLRRLQGISASTVRTFLAQVRLAVWAMPSFST